MNPSFFSSPAVFAAMPDAAAGAGAVAGFWAAEVHPAMAAAIGKKYALALFIMTVRGDARL